MRCALDNDDVDWASTDTPPGFNALLDGCPRVIASVKRERRNCYTGEDRSRVEIHLVDPLLATVLVWKILGQKGERPPGLTPSARERHLQLSTVVRIRIVDPAFQGSPQAQPAIHNVLAIAGPPYLLLGRVHHLDGGRHSGRRDQHKERDALRHRRCQGSDPTTLAEPPQASYRDANAVDDGECVPGLEREITSRWLPGRLALAPPVERDDTDADFGEHRVEMPVQRMVADA